ncbi:protein DEK-like isoform X2 [Abrus precatorius]|uniref:Protein DEK-like isoform X2 n=1 Tax=Abrus precatorius TaxID=3816 RepID=A0A8B8JPD3_ABRPR|nr:protein DEK-like isoform X2 [Abrus precatorius]
MATETLEDNKPPPQDKDDNHAPPDPKSQPNKQDPEDLEISEKDASSEVAKSEDKNVDDKDGASNMEVEEEADEKKDTDEHEDEEKDNEEEEEEEEEAEEGKKGKAKGRSKESTKKSKKKTASAKKGKKDPVTPTSERPTRERKTVERYSVPSPAKSARSSASKAFTIEKGRGTQLKDIPNVAFKLSKRKPDDNLHMLHSLLFGKKTKAHNLKRNIGQFSGYVWTENEEKQRAKVKERIDKCVKEKLLDFCDVLNIQINKANVKKEELSAKLLEFLESPHATTDILLAEKEQKGKKRTRKVTPIKSPGEASTETPAKLKQTSQSGKKRKQSSDDEEDDKAELSDSKDESQEDEDVAALNNESDDEESKLEEEEDKPKACKRTSKKIVKEGSVTKAGDRASSGKKTSVKEAKSTEKTQKKSTSKKSVAEHDSASASLSKSKQPASKKLKTVSEKDTKGKAASKKQTDKSSKALVKDQGKGKSNKKSKTEPTREDMHAVVVDILKEVDFNTATLSDILRQLGTHFGLDLMHRKAEVKDIITDVINNMSDEEDEGEEAENDGDADKDDDDDDEDA